MKTLETRTYSMARHRESPRSRKNLMVIDPLTPSQGHQFDRRLKFSVYPGLLLIPVNLICHMPQDHVQKIKFLTPPLGPRGPGPKQLCRFIWVTHTRNLVEFRIFFLTPPSPLRYSQVRPLGMTQAAKWISRLICFLSFICEKIHKVWFKNLWNWLCNSDLMIFDLLAPPQGPRARGPKKMAPVRVPFM